MSGSPVSEQSMVSYRRFKSGLAVHSSFLLLSESFYFNDKSYIEELCRVELTQKQIIGLPLLVIGAYSKQLQDCQILRLIPDFSEIECKAILLCIQQPKYKVIEYIEEIESDNSIISTTSVTSSGLGGSKTFHQTLCQVIVDKIVALQETDCKVINRYARFITIKSLSFAQELLDCNCKYLNLTGKSLVVFDLKPNIFVKELLLSNNELNDKSMVAICQFLQVAGLEVLRIDHNQFSQFCAADFGFSLEKSDLNELNVSCNNFGNEMWVLLNALLKCSHLYYLDISENNVTYDAFYSDVDCFLQSHRSISTFKCYNNNLSFETTTKLEKKHLNIDIEMNEQLDLNDVLRCTDEELKRIMEKKLLLSNDELKVDEYFLISDNWLNDWKNYLDGGDDPGPIDNQNQNEKFRAVSGKVWKQLVELHGGYPEIRVDSSEIQ